MTKNAASNPIDDYQTEDDLRTLTRAKEIQADAKRHQRAMDHGKKKVEAMQAVVSDADADDKLPKRGQRTATNAKTKAMAPAQRGAKVNHSSII